jgi:hypothetical protein
VGWEVGEAGEVSGVGAGGRAGVEAGEDAVFVSNFFDLGSIECGELTCLSYAALHLRPESLPGGFSLDSQTSHFLEL